MGLSHLWDESSGQSSQEWLSALNVDPSGLLLADGAQTPRAWQILEDDGRRTQVMLRHLARTSINSTHYTREYL